MPDKSRFHLLLARSIHNNRTDLKAAVMAFSGSIPTDIFSRDDLTGVVVPRNPKGHERPADVVGE